MKMTQRCTIIGLGFLMEYIFPCFRAAYGDAVSQYVNAVTADAADLEGKRTRLGIQVYLDDNPSALRAMQPDLIFFAPPPSVAPVLAESVLKEYYMECRSLGQPLPMLIAFPPSPGGAYYQKVLGEDLKVVNIIPNMVTRVGQEAVPTQYCHLLTFPKQDNFTEADHAMLESFLSPMGSCLSVSPLQILHVLSAEITAHPLTELADITARCLTRLGHAVSYRQTASAMRAHLQKRHSYRAPDSNNCSEEDVPSQVLPVLRTLSELWYDTLLRYLLSHDVQEEQARALLCARFDLLLHEAQVETREEIVEKCRKDATKGGMVELCMERYYAVLEPLIVRLISPDLILSPYGCSWYSTILWEIVSAVHERGSGLTRNRELVLGPRHHAVLFALLAREICSKCPDADELLHTAVLRYGRERGRRMAMRARKAGDPLDMASYFAYNEWSVSEGFHETAPGPEPYLHYHVLECPWYTAWQESGLLPYGTYYCRDVDHAVLEGFNPELRVSLPVWHSREGASFCDFSWLDAENSPARSERQKEIRTRIGSSAVRPFVYHCAHLYKTFLSLLRQAHPDLYPGIRDAVHAHFTRIFSYTELLLLQELTFCDFSRID